MRSNAEVDQFGRTLSSQRSSFREDRSGTRRSSSRDRRLPYSHRPQHEEWSSFDPHMNVRAPQPPPPTRPRQLLSTLYCTKRTSDASQPPLPVDSMGPLQSFHTFRSHIPGSISSNVQEQYATYCLEHMNKYADNVFRAALGEEWFQDRYHPVNLWKQLQETKSWALQESERFRLEVTQDPRSFLEKCSLEPAAKAASFRPPEPKPVADVSQESSVMETEAEVIAETSTPSLVLHGKHLPGHEHCTVYVTDIHACCPKAQLRDSIRNALQAEQTNSKDPSVDLTPVRILISAPTWSRAHDKFDRCAWVVMSSPQAARKAVDVMRATEIDVLQTPDPSRDKPEIAVKFSLSAVLHSGRVLNSLPESVSHPLRVQADLQRILKLVSLLDDLQDVAECNRFQSLIGDEIVRAAVTQPVVLLDLCLAYARRVHFLCYYAGRWFAEESQLLHFSSSVVFRGKVVAPPTGESTEFDAAETMRSLLAAEDVLSAHNVPYSPAVGSGAAAVQKSAEVEEGEEVLEVVEDADPSQSMATESSADATSSDAPEPSAAPKRLERLISLSSDKRIDAILKLIASRIAAKNSSDCDELKLRLESAELEKKESEKFEEMVRESCKFEADEKCRCCFPSCNKLFKALPFLLKHLKVKHEGFGSKALIQVAVPKMLERFTAEPLSDRLLPPIEVESGVGIELLSIRAALERVGSAQGSTPSFGLSAPPMLTTPRAPANVFAQSSPSSNYPQFESSRKRHSGYPYDDQNQSRYSGQRQYDDNYDNRQYKRQRQSFDSSQFSTSMPSAPVRLTGYVDVDAPKEVLVKVDYAATVVPRKKKYSIAKPAAASQ